MSAAAETVAACCCCCCVLCNFWSITAAEVIGKLNGRCPVNYGVKFLKIEKTMRLVISHFNLKLLKCGFSRRTPSLMGAVSAGFYIHF